MIFPFHSQAPPPGTMTNGAVMEDYFPSADGPQPKRRCLNGIANNSDRGFHPASTESTSADETDELRRVATQLPTRWKPRQEYKSAYIGELKSGPERITFTARVVNIYEQWNAARETGSTSGAGGKNTKGRSSNGSAASAAKGCFKILAKDDSGCILVSSPVSCVDQAYVSLRATGAANILTPGKDQSLVCKREVRRSPLRLTNLGVDAARFSSKTRLEENCA
jgi:hypothetical protein